MLVEADQGFRVHAPGGGDAVVGIAILDPMRAHHPRARAFELGRHLGGRRRILPGIRDHDHLAGLDRPAVRHIAGAVDGFGIDAELRGDGLDRVTGLDLVALLREGGCGGAGDQDQGHQRGDHGTTRRLHTAGVERVIERLAQCVDNRAGMYPIHQVAQCGRFRGDPHRYPFSHLSHPGEVLRRIQLAVVLTRAAPDRDRLPHDRAGPGRGGLRHTMVATGHHPPGALGLDPASIHAHDAIGTRAAARSPQRVYVRCVQTDFRHRHRGRRRAVGHVVLPLRVSELLDPGRLSN